MEEKTVVDLLVDDYGVALDDAVQAVGTAEDFIADMTKAGMSLEEIAEDVYSDSKYWMVSDG
jgi:hypothetical protein